MLMLRGAWRTINDDGDDNDDDDNKEEENIEKLLYQQILRLQYQQLWASVFISSQHLCISMICITFNPVKRSLRKICHTKEEKKIKKEG